MADDWFSANAPTPAPQQSGGDDWFAANAASAGAPSNGMGLLSAASAAGAAAIPAGRALAERIATSPLVTRGAALAEKLAGKVPGIGQLNAGKQLYDVASGQQSIPGAAVDFARNAILSSPGRLIRGGQALAGRAATALGSPAALPIAGGLAGLAGTTGFLAALQHDANRRVDIDYSKNTPDTAVAKVFRNMQTSEANRGRTLDERMDDPNDVMFRPDDSETVRLALLDALGR